MAFALRADSVNLSGHPCYVCDLFIDGDQPIVFEIDGERDSDGRLHASVSIAHHWCSTAVHQSKIAAFEEAARIARANGDEKTGAALITRAREIAAALEKGKAA